jgi:hypothetical protein
MSPLMLALFWTIAALAFTAIVVTTLPGWDLLMSDKPSDDDTAPLIRRQQNGRDGR